MRSLTHFSRLSFVLVAACVGESNALPGDPLNDSGVPDSALGDAATEDEPPDGDASAAPVDASSSEDAGAACSAGGDGGGLDVSSLMVTGASGAPRKGEVVSVTLAIENGGAVVEDAEISVYVDSQRFSDYAGVLLGRTRATLCGGLTEVVVTGGPFLDDATSGKHYALGSGGYVVSKVTVSAGSLALSDSSFENGSFEVATSGALLVPVVYDEGYLAAIPGAQDMTPEAYLTEVVTRPNELFTPAGSDPDGDGTYQRFEGGFDEMMGVHHLFRAFDGFPGEQTTDEGWCEDATFYAQQVLGMAEGWTTQPAGTRPERHGFDYLIALTPHMGGGVACGWIDVQVSGLIGNDLDRQQVVAVHESGHLFGAPHCDDVGDGAGGSLQGYVMCSGEKHAHYPGAFVWHATSRQSMQSHWD